MGCPITYGSNNRDHDWNNIKSTRKYIYTFDFEEFIDNMILLKKNTFDYPFLHFFRIAP